jgi:hypothetical protein
VRESGNEMNKNKAIQLAVECIRKEMKKYAFEANLYKRMGEGVGPTGKKAAEHYAELDSVIAFLEEWMMESAKQ